jgi:ubiquinone biosynthesis monooxygenase Coq7
MKPANPSRATRHYGLFDRLIMAVDGAVKGLGERPPTGVPSPADPLPDVPMSEADQRLSAAMMRVNHTGEVCAQALYSAQSAWATDPAVRAMLESAGAEELAHLDWCAGRLAELHSHPSRLDPCWFAGAYAIGTAFAAVGDDWSMGFLDETERQVVAHLEDHLGALPRSDRRSRAIVLQMQRDEARHSVTAVRHGARPLPLPLRLLMKGQAAVMKAVAARI